MVEENQEKAQIIINEDTAEIYVSGFSVGFSNSDVVLQWTRNGKQVLTMNMSFTLAKTLSQIVGTTVSNIEQMAGFEIKTTKELDNVFVKGQEE